ncbi:hypothetical protein MSPP1_001461 [Malassezia sp. CBS 17886]|nr:hypothetical protein MSPP1_001461 [Malassezia sp. CBS 17886]
MTTPPAFVLAAQLTGHQSDVRALASHCTVQGRHLLLSGSRDETARLWIGKADGSYEVAVINDGNGFVNAVAFAEDEATDILYAVTGSQDALINAYEIALGADGSVKVKGSPKYTLLGHTANVCSLRVYGGGKYIASGSWDGTVRIWKDWACMATLQGHTQAVWSVLPVDADRVLSAGADKTVRLWSLSQGTTLATLEGATQAVRDIALVQDRTAVVAAGNDGVIREYGLVGAHGTVVPQKILAERAAFVYALTELSSHGAGLASSGEDRSVHVWQDAALAEVLAVPAVSVWCLTALENGDLACGASDGIVRVFTRDMARAAPPAVQEAYETSVVSQTLSAADVEGVQPQDSAALRTSGSIDGQTILVADGAVRERYQWRSADRTWRQTGVVVEGGAPSQKKTHDGKEYDYVFDVDVKDDAPPLKLPYNAQENPYTAATRFLEANSLPASYLDQVVKFLETNTQAGVLGGGDAGADPYTGDERYASAPASTAAVSQPPVDPFTGDGGISSAAASLHVIPQTQMLAFRQANVGAARQKLAALRGAEGLVPADAAALDAVVDALTQNKVPVNVDVLSRLLAAWPTAQRFPLLDMLRVAVLHPCTMPLDRMATDALVAAEWDTPEASIPGDARKASEANLMLALRVIANGFVAPSGPAALEAIALETLATLLHPPWGLLNKAARTALASVVFNFSVVAVNDAQFAHGSLLLEMVTEILRQEHGDSEAVYRALMALGNLLVSAKGAALPKPLRAHAQELARRAESAFDEDRIRAVCADLAQL